MWNKSTNNHSSLVCTETKKKKRGKKNCQTDTLTTAWFRDCYQEENISPIPGCKGWREAQGHLKQDGGSTDVSVVLDYFYSQPPMLITLDLVHALYLQVVQGM